MFHDTLSGQLFALPSDKSTPLPIYVCGLTVYDYAHIGHARMFITFDTFRRGLIQQGYQPYFIQNITDIDDKILHKMNVLNLSLSEITEPYIQAMQEDRAALNVMVPDSEPRATLHIDAMLDLIQRLLDKGYAYVSDTGVQYRTPGNDDTDSHFALWKFTKNGERVSYSSPWGLGRPGWHIECSAMIHSLVGDAPLWMHGGGHDLHFPHHTNERLQSETAYGHPLAHHWMHNGFIRVNQEKMSKSLNNFFTIREVLKEVSAGTLRYYISKTHYRDHLEYSDVTLKNAQAEWRTMVNALIHFEPSEYWDNIDHAHVFNVAFNDDMNATQMWFYLHQWLSAGFYNSVWQGLRYLGLEELVLRERVIPDFIQAMARERWEYRISKRYIESDQLRQALQKQGYAVLDRKDEYDILLHV